MFRQLQIVVAVIGVIIFGLSLMARRFPDVAWLEPFHFDKHLTPRQRVTMRRRTNVLAGMEMILAGILLPLGYIALTVMFFNSFTPKGITLTFLGSALCIGLGITAIVRRNRG